MYRLLGQLLILIYLFFSAMKEQLENKKHKWKVNGNTKDRTTCVDEIDDMELLQDLIMYC